MQLHELRSVHRPKRSRRVGRGGKRGTYSGKGMKGQRSRAGRKFRDIEREMILRIPKRRGAYFKTISSQPALINLTDLDRAFGAGEKVTPRALETKHLVTRRGGRIPRIKLLGSGKLSKKLTVIGIECSRGAQEAVKRAYGKVLSETKEAK